MDYKKIILNRLLDKYERSRAYLDGGTARRIMLRLCSGDMPEYNLEDTAVREMVNSTVQALADSGIVKFEWMRFERGNIMDRVWLCVDRVEDAYREAGRVPKKEKADRVLALIRDAISGITKHWLESFLKEAMDGIDAKKSLMPYLPADTDTALAVLKALVAIDGMDGEECPERVFSIRVFGDSKHFERNVKKRVAGIIRQCLVAERDLIERPSDDEMLAQVGIVKAFEQVEFCGDVSGRLYGKPVDFSLFRHGTVLNSRTVKGLEIEGMGRVNRVLFIENKTNYMDYISKGKGLDELVIFHGGFYSPVKGEFFAKVYDAGQRSGARFYHWGDIDIGGFRMYKRLKENIIPSLKPYLMDKEAFMSKKKYWLPFGGRYQKALESMLYDEGYLEFHDVIEAMLRAGARLEQEAFL